MKIVKTKKYNSLLRVVLEFIAKDSPIYAKNFKTNLDSKIKNLPNMPYKFRKSIYFNDEKIRDLIYKGYTIPYFIDTEKQTILILGIVKYKENI